MREGVGCEWGLLLLLKVHPGNVGNSSMGVMSTKSKIINHKS